MSQFDAIVIGSGIGGLTTAAILAKLQDKRVLVLERHFRAGGFTHTFQRPGGYQWDVGIHYLGDMKEGSRGRMLLDFVTGGMEWNQMPDVYDRFLYPNLTFDVPSGAANYQAALINEFPAESIAIQRYFADVRKAISFDNLHIIAGAMPGLIANIIHLWNRTQSSLPLTTTAEYLERNFKDPQLKALLASQWMDYGLPPSQSAFAVHALIVNHYLGGAWYPEGGSGVIAESAQKVIESTGGKVLVNHEVEQIIVKDGRAVGVDVHLKNKPDNAPIRFEAPLIISDAGAWTTFLKLLPHTQTIPFREDLNHALSDASPGCSVVTVYLGLKHDPRCMGFQGENYWIFNGLDHDALASGQDNILNGNPNGCYLSFPSLKEKNNIHHTAEIIAPLSYASVAEFSKQPWRRRSDVYQQMKDTIAKTLLALVDTRFPSFSEMVAFSEVSTPITIEHFTAHPRGTIYGVPATPERYRQTWLKPSTPIEGLYLTGADAGSLGIMGALMGGVCAAARILGPLGLFSVMAAATRQMIKSRSLRQAYGSPLQESRTAAISK